MTQGPDLPEAYPRGIRGVRGKGKRSSHILLHKGRTFSRRTRGVTEEKEERGNVHPISYYTRAGPSQGVPEGQQRSRRKGERFIPQLMIHESGSARGVTEG